MVGRQETAPLLVNEEPNDTFDEQELELLKKEERKQISRERRRVCLCLGLAVVLASAAAITTTLILTGKSPLTTPTRRNVIMMVSDGFGPASQTYGRSFWQYKNNRTFSETTELDKILIGSSRTRSSNSLVTDSAAGATAFSCAKKSYNAAIGVDPQGVPCGTVLESAKQLGLTTGLVVTSRVTHATPAAFSAHVIHRDMESDIAVQQLGDYELGRQVDLMLGGGRCFFLPNTTEGSCRTDDRDLIKESKKHGWNQILFSGKEFLDQTEETPLELPAIGLFNSDHMNFEVDRERVGADEPALHVMAERALQSLKHHTIGKKGFFLMIEGSRIDMGAHNNDPVAHVYEILEYHRTIKVVKDFIKENPDTVMISTSDHETGGFTLGLQPDPKVYPDYLWRPEVIDKATLSAEVLARKLVEFHTTEKETMQSAQGPNSSKRRSVEFIKTEILAKGLGITDPTDVEIEYLSDSTVIFNDYVHFLGRAISHRANLGWTTPGHTGVDVNLYAATSSNNPKEILDTLRGNHENTDIGDFMVNYLGLDLQTITDRLVKSSHKWFKPKSEFTTTSDRSIHEMTGN